MVNVLLGKRSRGLLGVVAWVTLVGAASPMFAAPPAVCGDGIVQPGAGEQCDEPTNPCCDHVTCKYQSSGFSCGAANGCAQSVCNGQGACQNVARDNGFACDDANPCTTNDACSEGTCDGGPPLDCEDGNVCTSDTCNTAAASAATACQHAPNTKPCDDGLYCNGTDVCAEGTCGHAGDPCFAGASCNATCNEATDTCFAPQGEACGEDGNLCTDDACDGAGSCAHVFNTDPCDDGEFCNGIDFCNAGSCVHPGDPCAQGTVCGNVCNEVANNCLTPLGTACLSDLNSCTDDACDGAGNCGHAANTAPCDDGIFCNGTDVCGGGTCLHPGNPCEGGPVCDQTCNEAADNCHTPSGADCTTDDNVCTDDVCDGAGACSHPTNTAPCDDELYCNGQDTCTGGGCGAHAGDPCTAGAQCDRTCTEAVDNCIAPPGLPCSDDGNGCTDDACDGQGSCGHPANIAPCDDGLFCNGADVCAGGACQHVGDPCATGPVCHDVCDETADGCQAPAGTGCTDDEDACTLDQCDAQGQCAHPDLPDSVVRVAVREATNSSDRFCVDLALANCATPVSLLQGVVRSPGADFVLDPESVSCTGLPAGYTCRANQVAAGIRFVIAPPVTDPPSCITPTAGQAIVRMCVQDNQPVCSGQPSVPLELSDVQAVDCTGADAAPLVENSSVTCRGLLGDCDADGDIDRDDLLAQIEVALQSGSPPLQERQRCDDDCDGDVDVFDLRSQIRAILTNATPPIQCAGKAVTSPSFDAIRVKPSAGARGLKLVNKLEVVSGVQITLSPTGGPVKVTGARATKRTKGFTVVYRQVDPTEPVRVVILSPTGEAIRRGVGRIVKLRIARGRPRGKLQITDIRLVP